MMLLLNTKTHSNYRDTFSGAHTYKVNSLNKCNILTKKSSSLVQVINFEQYSLVCFWSRGIRRLTFRWQHPCSSRRQSTLDEEKHLINSDFRGIELQSIAVHQSAMFLMQLIELGYRCQTLETAGQQNYRSGSHQHNNDQADNASIS